MRSDSPTASFAAVAAGMYSASFVKCATDCWGLLVQLTSAPFKIKTYPVVDRLVFRSPAWCASL